jgi:predicted Zn-dependent peptidase
MALDRKVAPPAKPIRHVDFGKAETIRLSNGIPVHMIRSGKQPVIGLELLFRHGGLRHEAQPGAAFFTIKMLAEGTRTKDADTISHEIDQYGAFLQLSPGLDYSSADLYMLTKYVHPLLSMLRELITESVFPEEELHKLKAIQEQNLKVTNQKPNVLASKTIKAALFGAGHPYGRSLDVGDIASITRQHLIDFFEHKLRNQLEIVIAGDVNTEVLQALEQYFGDLSLESPSPSEDMLPPVQRSDDSRIVVEKPDNLQSSIRLALPLFTKDHPDFHKMKVLNTILGGYFGSRLMRNIREEKGLTYGINSGLVTLIDAGYFIVGTEVKKDKTAQVIDEIYKEISLLQQDPVPDTELITVKNYMAGRLLSSVDTPFALAEKFKNVYLHGLTYDFYDSYLDSINTIEASHIQEMADKYLSVVSMKEVIVGAYQ